MPCTMHPGFEAAACPCSSHAHAACPCSMPMQQPCSSHAHAGCCWLLLLCCWLLLAAAAGCWLLLVAAAAAGCCCAAARSSSQQQQQQSEPASSSSSSQHARELYSCTSCVHTAGLYGHNKICGYVWVGQCTHVFMHYRNPQIHLLWSREVLNLDLNLVLHVLE